MQRSNIGWTDYTWNPVTGCSKVSPGCKNCWAERFSHRQGWTENDWTGANSPLVVEVHEERLNDPREYTFPDGPGRVAVALMGDLFHEEVPSDFIHSVMRVVSYHPHLEFQLLTKRPERAANLGFRWPDNAIIGTTVEREEYADRIDALRDVDARQWVSFEPLIGLVGDVNLQGIDWVVVGGESAPVDERREMEHRWAEDILDQARYADVPFYFKQDSGPHAESSEVLTVHDDGVPKQVRIKEFPPVPDMVREARGDSGD